MAKSSLSLGTTGTMQNTSLTHLAEMEDGLCYVANGDVCILQGQKGQQLAAIFLVCDIWE